MNQAEGKSSSTATSAGVQQEYPNDAPVAAPGESQAQSQAGSSVQSQSTLDTPSVQSSSSSGPASTPRVQVIRPPAAGSSYRAPAAPEEEDPKPTAGELRRAFASTIAGRHGPDAPLMTRAMREREDAKLGITRKKWDTVRIRIRFSDQTQLETLLPSSAGLQELYDVVRSSFAPSHTAKRFLLVQALPRKDFSPKDPTMRGKSLADLGLAPAAMLQIRFQDESMNNSSSPAPLRAELLDHATDIPPPKAFDQPAAPAPIATSSQPEAKTQTTASGKPIPKWLLKGLSKK